MAAHTAAATQMPTARVMSVGPPSFTILCAPSVLRRDLHEPDSGRCSLPMVGGALWSGRVRPGAA